MSGTQGCGYLERGLDVRRGQKDQEDFQATQSLLKMTQPWRGEDNARPNFNFDPLRKKKNPIFIIVAWRNGQAELQAVHTPGFD